MWGCNYSGVGLGHMFSGGGILALGLTILIVMIIAALAFKILKAPQHRETEYSDRLDSLMILKNRFAKGEITEQEYQKMKQVLS